MLGIRRQRVRYKVPTSWSVANGAREIIKQTCAAHHEAYDTGANHKPAEQIQPQKYVFLRLIAEEDHKAMMLH